MVEAQKENPVADVLTDLLNAGLLDRLDGDDARFAKLERAGHAIAAHLHEHPKELIQAMLVGLDPDVTPDNSSIQLAKSLLQAEWKSVTSVYPSEPVAMLRSLLLAACSKLVEEHDRDAAIVWLTAADTVPFRRPGREEPVIRRILLSASNRTEAAALASSPGVPSADSVDALTSGDFDADRLTKYHVDRGLLGARVAASAGPQARNGTALNNANPNWPNSPTEWAYSFAERMSALIADTLETATDSAHSNLISVVEWQREFGVAVAAHTLEHQNRMTRIMAEMREYRSGEQTRLDALWWAESLYSDTLQCSYRDLAPELAAVVMALEFAQVMPSPPPASVGHLLAETVHRLPGCAYDRSITLGDILGGLAKVRDRLPADWTTSHSEAPSDGAVSLRDLVLLTLTGQDATTSLARAGIAADHRGTLPHLAHAVFRQQQAVRLAAETA